jgi:transposase
MPAINFRQRQLRGQDTAQRAWRLYVDRGLTQREIATELGVTRQAVTKALQRAEQVGLEALRESVVTHKALQLQRLERVYALAMEGYDRSIGARVKKASRLQTARGDAGAAERWSEVRTEEGLGDPRWLAEARGALAAISRLLGLDTPAGGSQPAEPDRPYAGLSDDEVRRELARILAKAGIDPATLHDARAGVASTHDARPGAGNSQGATGIAEQPRAPVRRDAHPPAADRSAGPVARRGRGYRRGGR